MLHSLTGGSLACLALLTAIGAFAQTRPTPATPQTDRPAFETYQPFTEEKLLPWKEANDTVGRVGGWKAYAREAQGESVGTPATPATQVTPVPPAKQATQAKPAAPDPHAGHGEKSK